MSKVYYIKIPLSDIQIKMFNNHGNNRFQLVVEGSNAYKILKNINLIDIPDKHKNSVRLLKEHYEYKDFLEGKEHV